MFNQNEIQSAASAISNAYRLVSCASSSQQSPDNSNNYILECEAILLRFRCHYQDGQMSISGSPHSVEIPSISPSALAVIPTPAMRSLPPAIKQTMSQSEEEDLIGQIEAALTSTIAELDRESKYKALQQEKVETSNKASVATLPVASVSTAAVAVTTHKLRALQSLSSLIDDRELPSMKALLSDIYQSIWLKLIEKTAARSARYLHKHSIG